MNKQIGNGYLELEVTDFGPIVEAKIDLRPLTVFVGPSNTGKSYLAILIYALHRVFGGDPSYRGRRGILGVEMPFQEGRVKPSKASIDALKGMAHSLKFDSDSDLRSKDFIVLQPPVADTLRSMFNSMEHVLSNEIGRCFGVSKTHDLLRKGQTGPSRVVIRRQVSGREDFAEHKFSLARTPIFKTTVPSKVPIPISDGNYRVLGGSYLSRFLLEENLTEKVSNWDFVATEILSSVGTMVLKSLVGPLHLPAYYLPADRTGVMHAHNVVVSALIASAPTAGLRPVTSTPTLSGVLADFLEQLIEIDRAGALFRKPKRDLSRNIEAILLGGSVDIERSAHIGYPSFVYRPHGWKDNLALGNASSMVSELAPVVLYLRHMIEPGNVLIIEEPESHLHPGMQVAFTRQIAALIKAGIRVIITTHSEWLLEELANIVSRSKLSKAERGKDPVLRSDQVGVWMFDPKKRPRGSIIREIRLDDSGMYPSGYDEVARALHNEWADISSRIDSAS